jgi:hypothetical protein
LEDGQLAKTGRISGVAPEILLGRKTKGLQ